MKKPLAVNRSGFRRALYLGALTIPILIVTAGVVSQFSTDLVADRGTPNPSGSPLSRDAGPTPSLMLMAPWRSQTPDTSFNAMLDQSGVSGPARRDLEAARRASAPFHSIDVAKVAGWPTDSSGCLDFPDGYMGFGPGAMGFHYNNPDLVSDGGALDPTRPELVLYEPQADGSLRMTAVEYIILESDRPRTDPPPTLFGQEIRFHPEFGVWGLHVWFWRHNPYGLFADVNPRVSCEHANQQ